MFIQFDAELMDEAQLLSELRQAGIEARSVRASRWVGIDPLTGEEFDRGGRIDVELKYEAMPQARPKIAALEAFMRDRQV